MSQNTIEVDHILSALLYRRDPVVIGILSILGVSIPPGRTSVIQRLIDRIYGVGNTLSVRCWPDHIKLSAAGKRIIKIAEDEASRMLWPAVTPEYLFLGLICAEQENGQSSSFQGLSLEAVREQIHVLRRQ